MSIVLMNYTGVVLDDTFFTHEVPQELHQQLRDMKVLLPKTLHECLAQNDVFLDAAGRKLLQHNGNLLPPKEQIAYMEPYPDLDRSLCRLSDDSRAAGERYLYITGKQLTIQNSILQELELDIFDLKYRLLIPAEQFQKLKGSLDFQSNGKEHLPDIPEEIYKKYDGYELGITDHLFSESGDIVKFLKSQALHGRYNGGSEASLFLVEDQPECIAKVLKSASRLVGKRANIAELQKIPQAEIPWAMFPQEQLFWDRERKHFAGYLQKYARNTRSLESCVPDATIEEDDSYKSESCVTALDTALKLTRQCLYLNNYGIYLCDFNPENFAFDSNDDRFLIMWDTDSFGGRDYSSGNFIPKVSYRMRDVAQAPGKKKEVIDMCTEQLYTAVYWIVTLQVAPWKKNTEDNLWYYVDPGQYRNLAAIVPERLQELFWQVFEEGELPSADLLLYELAQARKELDPRMTYGQLIQTQEAADKEQETDHGDPNDTIETERVPEKEAVQPEASTMEAAEIIWPPLLESAVLNVSLEDDFAAPVLAQMEVPKPVLSDSWSHGKSRTPKMRVAPAHPYQKRVSRRFVRFRRMTGQSPRQAFVGCYLPLWSAALMLMLLVAAAVWVALTADLTEWFDSEKFTVLMTPETEGFLAEKIQVLRERAFKLWEWLKGLFAALRNLM